MRYTVLGSALAVLLAPLAATTPAHAANEVTLTMTGGVLYDSCTDHDFNYSATLPAGYGPYWNMDVELVGPDGNVTATSYLYGQSRTGTDSLFLCDSPNLPGTYTIRGTGEMDGPNYTDVPISAAPSTVTFRLPKPRSTDEVGRVSASRSENALTCWENLSSLGTDFHRNEGHLVDATVPHVSRDLSGVR